MICGIIVFFFLSKLHNFNVLIWYNLNLEIKFLTPILNQNVLKYIDDKKIIIIIFNFLI